MKLLVTGASGFVGRYVVAAALRRGHAVRAMVRPHATMEGLGWRNHAGVEYARCDLRLREGLNQAVAGIDAVIHLAAAMRGDFYTRFAGTVTATEHLLSAMTESGVDHIVAVSSFAVYDYLRCASWSALDENSPLERRPQQRHAYAQTKLIQERVIGAHAKKHGWKWTVIRPGAVWGKDHWWTTRLGIQVGRWWVRLGARAPVPLTYVENCAEAIVLAAERPEAVGEVLNIVDDDPPSQQKYMAELRHRIAPRPRVFPVSRAVLQGIALMVTLVNGLCFGGRAKVPAVLVPSSLCASAKPLRYPNRKARALLGWRPRYALGQALARCFDDALQADVVDACTATERATHPALVGAGA